MTTPIPAMQAAAAALEALETAKTGLQWYRDMHPEDVDASDDEADQEIDAALSLLRAALETPSEAEQVCFEAYQIVGCLLSDAGLFDTPQAGKILDNLSQAKMVHRDVLPWPSVEGVALDAGEPQPVAWALFGYIEGEGWVAQHPVRFTEAQCESDKSMYATDALLAIRPLYASPVAAAPQGDAITVPQGWKLVPLEPTPEMTAAAAATPGIQAIDGASQVHQARGYPLPASAFLDGSPLEQAWRAMLAASPTLNEQGKEA